MAHRDGDGWIECNCGGKHWGLHGAAGLLLVRGRIIITHDVIISLQQKLRENYSDGERVRDRK